MTIYIFSLFISFLLASLFTYLFRKVAVKLGFVDNPEGRKIHCSPTPLLGGAAVVFSFYITSFLGIMVNPLFQKRLNSVFFLFFFTGVAIFILGLFDDKYRLKPMVKLFFQMLAISPLAYLFSKNGILFSNPLYFILGPKVISLSVGWSFLLNFVWMLFMINAFNFIDGIDGLATSIALISSLVLFLISLKANKIFVAYLFLTLTGTLIGFARYNNYPAQIFLGDAGSMFLGYLLSSLSIIAEGKSSATFSFIFPMLIFGVPIYDTLTVIARRTSDGRSIFSPDTQHLHHRLLKLGFTQKQIVIFMYIVSLLLGGITFLLLLFKNEFVALLCLLFSFIGIWVGERYLEKIKGKKSNSKK